MKKTACLVIPLAILLFLSVPCFAQTQYRFEVFAGGNFPKDNDFEICYPQSTVPLKGSHQFSAGARGGVRVGVDFKKYWGQDFIYSYGANATKIVNDTTGMSFPFTVRTHQFSYNGIWYPGGLDEAKKAFPYVTAGVGGIFNVLSSCTFNEALDPARGGMGQLRNETIFAFNAGGGVRFRFSKHLGFRFDARDIMSRAPRYGLPKQSDDPNAVVFPVGGVFHQFQISFALVYYFN